MSETIAPPLIFNFEQDAVKRAVTKKDLLEKSGRCVDLQTELLESTPRLVADLLGDVGRHFGDVYEVVVQVRKGNFLWSNELEEAIWSKVATYRSPSGSPVRLKVVRT